jgi:hypothetical protein
MRSLLIVTLLALSACASAPTATTEKFDAQCKSWVGKQASDLVSAWGVPTSDYKVDESTKLIEYNRQNGSALMPSPIGYQSVSMGCKITFTSKDGVIANYRWQGNTCRSE